MVLELNSWLCFWRGRESQVLKNAVTRLSVSEGFFGLVEEWLDFTFQLAEHFLIFHPLGWQFMCDSYSYGCLLGIVSSLDHCFRVSAVMVFFFGLVPAYIMLTVVSGRGVKVTKLSKFGFDIIPRDNGQKYLKSGHSILQRMASRDRRKVYPSWSIVISVVLFKANQFLIICSFPDYTNYVIND